MRKYRVFTNPNGYIDVIGEPRFEFGDGELAFYEGDNDVETAYFKPEWWRSFHLIESVESPLSKFLFIHLDGQYKIDTGRQVETTTEKITYISEHGSKCDVEDWAVVFTFDEHGFQIVDINDGIYSISYACVLVTDFVVREVEKTRGLQ